MKTVITYGTFDLFHIGHVRLLKLLRSFGDRLVVGCSTDDFNERKGKRSIITFDQRCEVLQSCRYVDDVFAETDWGQKRSDIIRERADIFAIGDDWVGKFDDLTDICSVVYVPRTQNVSSTEIRQAVDLLVEERVVRIRKSVEDLYLLVQHGEGWSR